MRGIGASEWITDCDRGSTFREQAASGSDVLRATRALHLRAAGRIP